MRRIYSILLVAILLIVIGHSTALAGWLSGYGQRMSMEVANPSATGDRQFKEIPFPAWFLRDQGKITQADYDDVRVTRADGTTILPHSLNTDKNKITIDYASMPAGITTLYVYYGNAGATAPTAASFAIESGGTLLESGFENETIGNNLNNPPWVIDIATPTVYQYNHDWRLYTYSIHETRNVEVKLQGLPSGSSGVKETVSAGMSTDGAEFRFWKLRSANGTTTSVDDYGTGPTNPNQSVWMRWQGPTKQLEVYTDQAGFTGYPQATLTSVDTYVPDVWFQYKITLNWTNKTYTLAKRRSLGSPWQYLKSATAPDYNIPMRGGSATQWNGVRFSCYQSGTLFLDDVRYSDTGITEKPDLWKVQAIAPNAEVTSEGDTSPKYYVWGDDIDATYLDSANATTYYGEAASLYSGVSTAGTKYHMLLKYFEGALPKGTVSSAKLWLYLESNANVGESTTLKFHRFKNTGGTTLQDYVKAGWSNQQRFSYPTWTNRYYDHEGPSIKAWQTAGGEGADEINKSDPDSASLVLAPSFTIGYQSITLANGWFTAWQGDEYSMGINIMDSTDVAGANDRYVPITAPDQVNSPVIEVAYSALDVDQLAGRKLTTDKNDYVGQFPTNDSYALVPNSNSFCLMMWFNAESRVDMAYVTASGRIHRFVKNMVLNYRGTDYEARARNNQTYGLVWDPVANQAYTGTTSDPSGSKANFVYSDIYDLGSWFTVPSQGSTGIRRGTIFVKDGTLMHAYGDWWDAGLYYQEYEWDTNTWSAQTQLATTTLAGTVRGLRTAILSTDVMTGSGTLELNGTLPSYYPTFGTVKINNEYFWYTGLDTGNNNLTGVTREAWGSTAADHSIGATATYWYDFFGYETITYDSVKDCIHLILSEARITPIGFNRSLYLRHYITDALGTWKDEADSIVTLPLDQVTFPTANPSGKPTFANSILALDTGDVLVAANTYADPTDVASHGDMYVLRLANLASSWAQINIIPHIGEGSFVDAEGDYVVLTGLDKPNYLKMQQIQSEDNGATWGASAIDLSTHTLAAYALWTAGMSHRTDYNSKFYMYAGHYAANGAIYVNAVQWISQGPSSLFLGGGLSPMQEAPIFYDLN